MENFSFAKKTSIFCWEHSNNGWLATCLENSCQLCFFLQQRTSQGKPSSSAAQSSDLTPAMPWLSASILHCPALHQNSMLSPQGRESLVMDLCRNSEHLKYFFFFFLKEISQFCYLKPLLDKYFSDSPLSPLKAFLYRKQFLFSSQPKRTRSSQRFD